MVWADGLLAVWVVQCAGNVGRLEVASCYWWRVLAGCARATAHYPDKDNTTGSKHSIIAGF